MKNQMLLKVAVAMFLAVIAGNITGTEKGLFGVTFLQIYDLIGRLFLNALTLVVVPLVASSIITGTARMRQETSFQTLGATTFGFYFLTTALAVLIGLVVVWQMEPGTGIGNAGTMNEQLSNLEKIPGFSKGGQGSAFSGIETILLKLIPSNILAVASQGQMLGLILFSLLFGFFIPQIEKEYGSILLGFWSGLFQVMMCLTQLVMKALPIGVFGLVAGVVATTGFEVIRPIAYFFMTILIAFGLYACIVLPLLLKVVAGVSPLQHLRAITPALFTAFSTSSSAATLPVTIDCMEKRANISNRICSFTLPLATTLNLSGTGLYNCASVVFICQVYGLEISFSMLLFIAVISLLTSFGMAGIPSASIAAIVMILQTLGLPADGVVLIMAVERILDMFRTSINVFGNTCCAVLVAKLQGEEHVLDT